MKIYIASYEDPHGIGFQKLFNSKKLADEWMFIKFVRDYCSGYGMSKEDKVALYQNHKNYSAFSANIKQFTVK